MAQKVSSTQRTHLIPPGSQSFFRDPHHREVQLTLDLVMPSRQGVSPGVAVQPVIYLFTDPFGFDVLKTKHSVGLE